MPILLALLLLLPPAQAAITDVRVSADSDTIALDRPTTVTITWTVTREQTRAAGEEIRSEQGEYRRPPQTGGRLLGTENRPLSRRLPLDPTRPQDTVTFRETLHIPSRIPLLTALNGDATLHYQRRFDDGFGSAEARLTLRLAGRSAAPFGISRISLRFDDATPIKIAPIGAPIGATARIAFSGSGQLRAQWEIAEPDQRGDPTFRPLSQIRRYLTGGGTIDIPSPPLPSERSGLYTLRLNIQRPASETPLPVLRYFITPAAGRTAPMEILSPPPRAALGPRTTFAWKAVDGARFYQIEILAAEGQAPPLTGLVIPAPDTEARLPAHTRAHLLPGERYLWRLRALDEHGRLLAESPPRPLHPSP